ncbi:MAG: hypothetical protein ABIG69_07755 [Bacteroidota bacterium]
MGEAYRKRQYEAHFVSKTSDADMLRRSPFGRKQ